MAIEIEIKAWVDDAETVKNRLAAAGEHRGSYRKDDEYWKGRPGSPDALGSGVRLRRTADGPEAVVNFKRKEVRDGMEINDEREFGVSDAAAFAELLTRLGLQPWMRKRKIGEAWDIAGITAELSLVEGLGTFIELEILAEEDSAETVDEARSRLLAALDGLGVPRRRIEPRYYTEMLREAADRGRTDFSVQRPVR